jgi:hypothetical protein
MPTRRETIAAAALLAGSVGLARSASAEPASARRPASEAVRTVTIRLGHAAQSIVTLSAGEVVTLRLVNVTAQPLRIRVGDLPDRRLKPDATDMVTLRAAKAGRIDLIATGPQGVYAHDIRVLGRAPA